MTSRDSASAIRVLRWLIAASVVFPLALFGYAGVTNYRAAWTGAVTSQVYGRNFLGQAYGQTYAYNPWTGLNYNSGF